MKHKYYDILQTKKGTYALFYLGLLAVLLQMLPYILLGEGTVIPYHDQMDGEMLAYIFRAKYLFGGEWISEFMGGAYKTALTPPAPAFVLLFCVMKPFLAYALMHFIEIVIAYVGMYLLAREVKAGPFFSVLFAGVFAYLPFLQVYGLSQFGIPLLLWFYLRVRKQKNCVGAIIYCAIYTLCSSLVLVGFGILLLCLVEIVFEILGYKKWQQNKERKKTFGILIFCFFEMIILYCIENYQLIFQMLGIGKAGEIISHKSEYTINHESFLSSLSDMLIKGGSHSEDYHIYLVVAILIGVVLCVSVGRKSFTKEDWKPFLKVLGYILALILLAAFWQSGASALLKEHLGFLSTLAIGRVMWIVSSLWYLAAAMLVGMLGKIGWRKIAVLWTNSMVFLMLCIIGIQCVRNGTYPANVCRIIGREYSSISFEEYYAVGVLEQVKDYIYETTGKTPEEYRVLSLGIDPAAAYYHGFYCLDGYSNNYSVDYKHKFRKIIAPELMKNEYLQKNFDEWGNRCYLWCAQIPGYYNFEKNTSYFWNYEIDTKAAKELGANYIFSAVYLTNAEEIGLKRVREEPFDTPDSYYGIYLYELE